MREVVDRIQPGHPLPLQKIHRVAFALLEERNEQVSAGGLLFTARLAMQNRSLQDMLKGIGEAGPHCLIADNRSEIVSDKGRQGLA